MRWHNRILFRRLCLAELALMCTAIAGAQLSTSTGGSLSNPLDTNLGGPDSGAATTLSGAIEPGANNLMTPEDRVLPYDAIGASIEATTMSPSATQFYPLMFSRIPYQVDSTLKDATFLTGQRIAIPANIVDIITRKPDKLGLSAPATSFGPTSALSSALLQGKGPQGMGADLSATFAQQSRWKAGGSTAAQQAINAPASSTWPAQQQSAQPSDMGTISLKGWSKGNDLLLKKKDNGQGVGPNTGSSTPDKTQDYSRSPLEAPPAYGDQPSITVADSPFENLGTYSFLNPDITRASPRRSLSRREKMSSREKEKMLAASRTGQGFSMRVKSREMSPDETRLKKLSSGGETLAKPKWHNPILQQMETEANPNRQ